jgi:membrane carboxypeptidase/penicillin-binding protein
MGKFTKSILLLAGSFLAVVSVWLLGSYVRALHNTPAIFAAAERKHGTGLPKLPAGFRETLLRVEDPAFERHHGVDLRTPGAGATTITQSLVKGLFFERFRPGIRKLEQTAIAFAVDRRISKDRQLALFIRSAYLGEHEGHSINGFPKAAIAYFGKELAALHEDEWLALIAMGVAPNGLHVRHRPYANRERVARIRKLLAGQCKPSSVMDVMYERCR